MNFEIKYNSEIARMFYKKGEEYLAKGEKIKETNLKDEKNCILFLEKSKYFFEFSNCLLRDEIYRKRNS